MLALYRSGRQADALEAYRSVRGRLDDELGLEPAQELRELEASILRQDEALAAPAGSACPSGPSARRRPGPLEVTSPRLAMGGARSGLAIAATSRPSCFATTRTDPRSAELARRDRSRDEPGLERSRPESGRARWLRGQVGLGRQPRRQVIDPSRFGDSHSGGDDPVSGYANGGSGRTRAVWVVNGRLGTLSRSTRSSRPSTLSSSASARSGTPEPESTSAKDRSGLRTAIRRSGKSTRRRSQRRVGYGWCRTCGACLRVRRDLGRELRGRHRASLLCADLRARRR